MENGKSYTGNPWNKATWFSIPETYYGLLRKPFFFLVPALLFLILLSRRRGSVARQEPVSIQPRSSPPLPDVVAAVGFAALPIIEVVLTKIMGGGFSIRYALPAVIGFSILLAFAAHALERHARGSMKLLPVWLLGCYFLHLVTIVCLNKEVTFSWRSGQPELPQALGHTDGLRVPLVIEDGNTFVQYAYYRLESGHTTLAYIIHSNEHEDTTEIVMRKMRPLCVYDIEEYKEFVKRHPRFLLLVRYNDLYNKLLQDGARMQIEHREDGQTLYLVMMDAPPS
jgi:hypothetical protein